MKYIPGREDIIWLDFEPGSGRDIMERRPAFVISRQMFNEHTEMAILAPITSTIRGIKLEVVLPEEFYTKGSVLVHQLKSLDFGERNTVFIEKAPQQIIEQVATLVKLIVQ